MTTASTAFPVYVRVGPYNVNPESAIDKASVISHEYGHSLGLPDYYSSPGSGRETYGDWNLMATDKSQNMDVIGKKELGWLVPRVLKPGATQANGWRDTKINTHRIDWVQPNGTPYTLTGTGVNNGEAYVATLPARRILDPRQGAVRLARLVVGLGQRLRLHAGVGAQPRHPGAGARRPAGRHAGEAHVQVLLGHRVGLRLRLRAGGDADRRRRHLHVARVGEGLLDAGRARTRTGTRASCSTATASPARAARTPRARRRPTGCRPSAASPRAASSTTSTT